METYAPKIHIKRSLEIALTFQAMWVAAALVALWLNVFVDIKLLSLLLFSAWVPALVELALRTKLPDTLHIHYLIFMTAGPVGGSGFGVYGYIPQWDTIVHAYSGVFLAWFGIFGVLVANRAIKAKNPRWLSVAAGLAAPLAFAALWEISEFLSDVLIKTTSQANLEDTIVDMIAALVGAAIGLLIAWWAKYPKSISAKIFTK